LRLTDLVRAKVPRGLLTRFAPVGAEVEGEGASIFDYIQNGMIDWSKTKAVCLPDGLIYMNTEDRPQGIITAEDYKSVRNELVRALGTLQDNEAGEALNTQVYVKEELYSGDFMADAPDVYLAIENYSVAAFPNIRGNDQLMGPLGLAGHRLDGMLIVTGEQVVRGGRLDSARIIDLAPTILHVMGVPVPEDMDGDVLRDIFRSDSQLATGKKKVQDAQSRLEDAGQAEDEEDEEEIRKRLEELGYM
jgi:predicted AlkP superfamily phosphohydrolase/phosphomutase